MMTRTAMKHAGDAPPLETIRPAMFGDLFGYDEQFCSTCRTWQPRFYGSRMYQGKASTFTECRDCR
jgi:hypothetical protein